MEVNVQRGLDIVAGLGLDFGAIVHGFYATGHALKQGFTGLAGQALLKSVLQARPVLVLVHKANGALRQATKWPETLVDFLKNCPSAVTLRPENGPVSQQLLLLEIDLTGVEPDVTQGWRARTPRVHQPAAVFLHASVLKKVRQVPSQRIHARLEHGIVNHARVPGHPVKGQRSRHNTLVIRVNIAPRSWHRLVADAPFLLQSPPAVPFLVLNLGSFPEDGARKDSYPQKGQPHPRDNGLLNVAFHREFVLTACLFAVLGLDWLVLFCAPVLLLGLLAAAVGAAA